MKKAYEYLENIESCEFMQSDDIFYRDSVVEELIKKIQKDTIDYVVKECVDNAWCEESNIGWSWEVNEQSILSVADKLKKEIDES